MYPGMTNNIITTTVTAVALAAVCACNDNTRENTRNTPPANETPIAKNAPSERQALNSPIEVTGCLQKEGGLTTTYIVTGVNEPSQKGVGTTGSGAAVEREQLRSAENSYRVETKDKVDMDSMVGKQVRVSGVMARRADLPDMPAGAPDRTGTAGNEPRTMEKIDKGDLAKIDDASIAVVADNCGGHAERPGSEPRPGAGKKD